MNKKITLLAILLLATVSSLFSAPQLIKETKISIVDYKNKNMGEKIPQWVIEVAKGNLSLDIFRGVPNFDKNQNNEFFIMSRRDKDFNKLITKAENEMKKEYSSIFQRRFSKAAVQKYKEQIAKNTNIIIETPLNFNSYNTSKLTEDANHFLQTLSYNWEKFALNYTIGDLPSYMNKFCDFWVHYEVTNSKNEVVDSYYDYYVVYTADTPSYTSEIEKTIYFENKANNNFSFRVQTPNGLSLFEKYNTVIDMELNTEGNINHSFIETLAEQEESDIIPIFSHSRAPNIELCKESSLENDIYTKFDLVLPKEKITSLVYNKNEIAVKVYNNDEYMCTDYFCIYELNKKDIKKAMKSYY